MRTSTRLTSSRKRRARPRNSAGTFGLSSVADTAGITVENRGLSQVKSDDRQRAPAARKRRPASGRQGKGDAGIPEHVGVGGAHHPPAPALAAPEVAAVLAHPGDPVLPGQDAVVALGPLRGLPDRIASAEAAKWPARAQPTPEHDASHRPAASGLSAARRGLEAACRQEGLTASYPPAPPAMVRSQANCAG